MRRTRSLRWLASRSAMTLPAKPAPTISQSYMRLLRGCERVDGDRGARAIRLAGRLEHQPVHRAPGLVPRAYGEMPVDAREPGLLRALEQALRLAHHLERRLRDLNEPLLAVRPHHVRDRRRHDRHAGRKELRRLGRADEARRLVQRERHQADIPARQIARKVRITLSREPMDVA